MGRSVQSLAPDSAELKDRLSETIIVYQLVSPSGMVETRRLQAKKR